MSKWSKDITKKFIHQYEIHPCLWDRTNPLYRDRDARNDALREITAAMPIAGLTMGLVRTKICALRGTYNMELKKIYRAKKNGEKYAPGLSWFKDMDRFITTGQKKRNIRLTNNQNLNISLTDDNDDSSDSAADHKSFLIFKPKSAGENSPSNNEILLEEAEDDTGLVHTSPSMETATMQIPEQHTRITLMDANTHISPHQCTPVSIASTSHAAFNLTSAVSLATVNEFELFAKQVALQLQQLPLDIALDLQMQIHALICRKRIECLRPLQ